MSCKHREGCGQYFHLPFAAAYKGSVLSDANTDDAGKIGGQRNNLMWVPGDVSPSSASKLGEFPGLSLSDFVRAVGWNRIYHRATQIYSSLSQNSAPLVPVWITCCHNYAMQAGDNDRDGFLLLKRTAHHIKLLFLSWLYHTNSAALLHHYQSGTPSNQLSDWPGWGRRNIFTYLHTLMHTPQEEFFCYFQNLLQRRLTYQRMDMTF